MIGIFDSGVGGLTVLREIRQVLPHEDILYLGDTARVPYGTRSPETILQYTLQAASFLMQQKIKLLILACHTACSYALTTLQLQLPIPVVGVIQSNLSQLKKLSPKQGIAILGTTGTIHSGLYQNLLHEIFPSLPLYPVACPLFVPMIEEGLANHPATHLIAEHYLQHLRTQPIDATLLACTHYPLLRPILQKVIGDKITLIEPAVAEEVHTILLKRGALQPTSHTAHLQFCSTDDPEKFEKLAHLFFHLPIENVKKIQLSAPIHCR